MIIHDGLAFVSGLSGDGRQAWVIIECRSESGKVVNFRYAAKRDSDLIGKPISAKEIGDGIADLTNWFYNHTREAQAKSGLRNPKIRPLRAAGFLRRLTEEELRLPQYGSAKRVDSVKEVASND